MPNGNNSEHSLEGLDYEVPALGRRSTLALFWGMIVRPRDTLTYLRDAGRTSWLWPAILAAFLLVISLILITPIAQAEAKVQLEDMQQQFTEGLSPEQQAQIQQVEKLISGPFFTVVIPSAMGVIGLALGWLLRSGVLYLLSLALGGQVQFSPMFRMGVWTTLPDILRRLVITTGTLLAGRTLTSGLAFLVPSPQQDVLPSVSNALLMAFLSKLDIYLLWGLVLTTVGVVVTARVSWRKGTIVTLIFWLLALGTTILPVWISTALAAQAGLIPSG
jgi:hypothetical protein